MKDWCKFIELVREELNKFTQLIKYQHEHRLEAVSYDCARKLRDLQETAARRHGKLMQKVQ